MGTPKRWVLPTAISAPNSPGGVRSASAHEIRSHHHEGTDLVDLRDESFVVQDLPVGGRIREESAENIVVEVEALVVSHHDLDPMRLSPGLNHSNRLGMAKLRNEEGVPVPFRLTLEEGHGLGRRRSLVEEGRIGDFQTGHVNDHGLEVQEGFQTALGDLGLIRGVLGVPPWVLQDVSGDDPGGHRVVVAHPDEGPVDLVPPGDVPEFPQQEVLRGCLRQIQIPLQPDRIWDRIPYQALKVGVSERTQHLLDLTLSGADVPANEITLRIYFQ